MKNLAISYIVVIVGLLGGCNLFQPTPETTSATPQPSPSEQTEASEPIPTTSLVKNSDWSSFAQPNYRFLYPPEADVQERESELVIVFMGPKQIASGRTQTELFDGYSVRIGSPYSQADDAVSAATEARSNAVENCNNPEGKVDEISTVDVSGYSGYQFSVSGCRLDYTSTFVEYNNVVYNITQSYVGTPEDQQMYQEITEQIRESIVFSPANP